MDDWLSLDKTRDVLSTGRSIHKLGFYHDKSILNRALMKLPIVYGVAITYQMLELSEYLSEMSRSKFVATSHRYGLGQSWRVFEALASGAMVITDSASGAPGRFSQNCGCIHTIRAHAIEQDLEYHLSQYPDYVKSFTPKANQFFEELYSLVPPNEEGVAKQYRTLLIGVLLGRIGFPDRTLETWTTDPHLSLFRAHMPEEGAGYDSERSILHSHYYVNAMSLMP